MLTTRMQIQAIANRLAGLPATAGSKIKPLSFQRAMEILLESIGLSRLWTGAQRFDPGARRFSR